MTTTLTREEVEKRVALLKRLKATLAQQRAKFQNYLQVLDAEQASLEADAIETLQAQVVLEEELVVDIHAIQKVIDPLEAVLQEAYEGPVDDEVTDLRSSLETLKVQVQQKSLENRGLLSKTMDMVQREIVRIRPQVRGRNPYAGLASKPSMVDIST
jgi:flagellar biosynthesis/type III secretory pathway chaperone